MTLALLVKQIEQNVLDKYTFGSTPASIYLVDQLNKLRDPKLNRKVTRQLTSFNQVINELLVSNAAGLLTAHTVGTFISVMRQRAQNASRNFEPSLIANLVANVMTGKVKELERRVTTVRHCEQNFARFAPDFKKDNPQTSIFPLLSVEDPITPEVLTERSKQRLTRKGKQSFL